MCEEKIKEVSFYFQHVTGKGYGIQNKVTLKADPNFHRSIMLLNVEKTIIIVIRLYYIWLIHIIPIIINLDIIYVSKTEHLIRRGRGNVE